MALAHPAGTAMRPLGPPRHPEPDIAAETTALHHRGPSLCRPAQKSTAIPRRSQSP
jgi:hypothetical protein